MAQREQPATEGSGQLGWRPGRPRELSVHPDLLESRGTFELKEGEDFSAVELFEGEVFE
jgi:hypothetical protein